MPSRIDRGARFRELCAIATNLIAREGIAAPSTRRLAAEAEIGLSSVRHLFPSQESLLLRVAAEIRHRWPERWPIGSIDDQPRERARAIVAALIPCDEETRAQARAWQAFAAIAHGESPLAESVRRDRIERASVMTRVVRELRWLAVPRPRPSLVTVTADRKAQAPADLEPEALHLLIVTAGLNALLCDHEVPLPFDAAARWLNWWHGPQLESLP